MTSLLNNNLRKAIFCLSLLAVFSLAGIIPCNAATENYSTGASCSDKIDNDGDGLVDSKDPGCDNSVDKGSVMINVSTADQDSWYDESDKSLHTFAVCDSNPGAPYNYSPCNSDGIHDDYYSTDTPNEVNVAPAEKRFTIRVDAADAFGINKIQIEWLNVGGTPNAQAWENGKNNNGSFTCSGAGTCTICTKGGGCENEVINPSSLIIPDGKDQQRFFFRVTVLDNNDNVVTTGFDDDTKNLPVLDKFYRFVICSTDCHADSCKPINHAPSVSVDGYDEADNFCYGLKYKLKWIFFDEDNDKQEFYSIEIREKGTTSPVYSVSRQSSDNFFYVFDGVFVNGDIEYNKVYEWRVKVSDDDKRALCRGTSEWSAWSNADDSFKTPLHPYPKVSFTVKDPKGKDCSSEVCGFLEDIYFSSTSTVYSAAGTPTYRWYINDSGSGSVYSTDQDASRKFLEADGSTHKIKLYVTDGDGYTCSAEKDIMLKKSNATWNEVAPRQ